MRRTEGTLVPLLQKYTLERFRMSALSEAWDEFTNDMELELSDDEPPPEFESFFIPWFLFNWIDDDYFEASRVDLVNKPIAMLYLEEKGQQLDSFQQRFIKSVCAGQFSFYVVTDVFPGERLELRDLILNQSISVYERQGSEQINVGTILFARVMTMDNSSIMVGCAPYLIPATYQSYFIDLRQDWRLTIQDLGDEILFEFEDDIRQIYHDIIEQLNNPVPPKLVNSEGDTLEFSQLHYQLDCSVKEAFSALQTLAIAISESALLEDGIFDSQGNLKSIEFPWLEKIGTEKMKKETTVKGTLTLSANKLIIDVNSHERADAIKRKISRRLGKRATFKNAVIQSTKKMLEAMPPEDSERHSQAVLASKELEAQPEVQLMLKEMAAKHWQNWLDMPLPALNDKTPRESAKTTQGRERLDALFLQFKGMSNMNTSEPFNPDIDFLRKELGID